MNKTDISLRTAASHRITHTEKTYKSNNNILKSQYTNRKLYNIWYTQPCNRTQVEFHINAPIWDVAWLVLLRYHCWILSCFFCQFLPLHGIVILSALRQDVDAELSSACQSHNRSNQHHIVIHQPELSWTKFH